MHNSRQLAGMAGPVIVAVTASEMANIHIWAANTAAGIHLNGSLLFIAGLYIIRVHNCWVRGWPVAVTLAGWFAAALGLFRMFAPGLQLQMAQNSGAATIPAVIVLAGGVFLSVKAYSKG